MTLELKCTTKFVDLSDGITLYTEQYHLDAAAPSTAIVCIHGLGSSSTTFDPIIKPLLSALLTAHILAYDWAGSGSSPRPPSVSLRTASDLVSDLDTLIAAKAPSAPLVLLAGTRLASRWLLAPSRSRPAPTARNARRLPGRPARPRSRAAGPRGDHRG